MLHMCAYTCYIITRLKFQTSNMNFRVVKSTVDHCKVVLEGLRLHPGQNITQMEAFMAANCHQMRHVQYTMERKETFLRNVQLL